MNITQVTRYIIHHPEFGAVELDASELREVAQVAADAGLEPAACLAVHADEAELARTRSKISAIKAYRTRTHANLKESKDAVDAAVPVVAPAPVAEYQIVYSNNEVSGWLPI